MISLEEARSIIAGAVHPRAAVPFPLLEAHGCALAGTITADGDYPSADRSMMDGYAVVAPVVGERYRVVAEIQAGSVPTALVAAGECARIYTGAHVPDGATHVVPQELVERDGDWMLLRELPPKRFIRPKGAEARQGDTVLTAGARLGATELAILAQVGAVTVPVIPGARVQHVATGNELVAPDSPLAPGQIRDTNSSLLFALLRELGTELIGQSRCGDDPAPLTAFVRAFDSDLLLISGGASVGDYDFGARALRDADFTIHFDKVNLRPGKPLTFATRGEQAAFVIPGNPVSHFVCFEVAIRLAIETLQGFAPAWSFVDVQLDGTEGLRGDPRQTFWPAKLSCRDGTLVAAPRRWSSSGDTFSLAGTNALLRVDGDVEPGGRVSALISSILA